METKNISNAAVNVSLASINCMSNENLYRNTPETHYETVTIKTEHDVDSQIKDIKEEINYPVSNFEESDYIIKSEQTSKIKDIMLTHYNKIQFLNSEKNKESLNTNGTTREIDTIYKENFKSNDDLIGNNVKMENIDLQSNITFVDINNILAECSGPRGSNCAEATDDVFENKTSTGSIPMEELEIKAEQKDIKYEEKVLEITIDKDTEITRTPGKEQVTKDTGPRQCKSNMSNFTEQKQTSGKRYECGQCGKTFSHRGHFITHERTHTSEKPFKCDNCGKTFSIRINLVTHQRTHTGEKPFRCSQCDKIFSRKSLLIMHIRTHTGEKPFSCDQCDKMFSQRSHLIGHKRIHTGSKPFKCDQCDIMFSKRCNLNNHKRIHTGEKPFKCDQCDKMLPTRCSLINHKRIHTGEKPFRCEECGKTFSQKSHLNYHKKIHTAE